MFRGKTAGLVILALLAAVIVTALVAYLFGFQMPGDDGGYSETGPRIVALLALLVVIGGSMAASPRQVPALLRSLLIWGALGALLVTGYAWRDELEVIARRVVGTLVPGMALTDPQTGTITIIRDGSSHYRIAAQVNGTDVDFLFDTGASAVTLTDADARAAGLDPSVLSYTVPVSTANGRTEVATVRLDRLQIGELALADLRAFVARPGALETSLLGMSAMDRLKSWRVEGNRLILEP
ncbi:TIGR02281 family clan AA aspartic protease [Stappia sp. WLB 29]|uniref:retropepsin-like aspartic protease family protein n=1 Tax=Stappia sp. WLB 29 TaxID=2925220 RepID=UPI0020C11B24|nr:TIGR02281 family clan AA aspartic protease [Stappia sp. WLB 29]